METEKLYIIGGNNLKLINKIIKTSKVVFLDKENEEFENQFSILKNFKEKEIFLTEKWMSFQDQVFKKIKPELDKDEDFKYILSNLFFEASPNKTTSIYQFFKLYLLIEYIKKEKFTKVVLINVSEEIKNFFNSNINNFSFYFEILSFENKKNSIEKIKNFAKKNTVFSVLYCLYSEYKKKKQKILPSINQSKKVAICYYYPGGQSCENGFYSKYYEAASSLLSKTYGWLFLFVGNISTLGKENEKLKNKINTFGFLDAFFSSKDLQKIIFNFLKVKKKLEKINTKNLFFFEKIDYFYLIKNDWITSKSILLIELMILEKKILNFLKLNPQINEIIYLMEFQPWEAMLNKIAKKKGIITKGVIHSVVRQNMMNFYHSKLIHPYHYTPSFVGVNSNFSKSLLLNDGFDSDQIIEIEAQRFNYLTKKSYRIYNKISKLKKSILIITSILPNETKELLEYFALSNNKFEKVYIKEHPLLKVGSMIKSSIKNFPNFEIVNGTVSEALELSDIVYAANGSSVLLESVVKKKQTVSLISLSTLPIPAINKAENLYFVYDVISLSEIFNKLIVTSEIEINNEEKNEYLYLNEDFSLWRKFIEK
ncbi:hypothetical protein [Candidatus Pelagibacter sp. FZCC0015]|uniref:hypothetical protein n=1 Tax=Candidatus Pelagibacter sp. FZCC0015 TaxID=2268451 RepID=UPI0011A4DF7A|nr:hypothetical protein [Candidatus Pelagibacter sp. FZCC0015]